MKRRTVIGGVLATAAASLLSACNRVTEHPAVLRPLRVAEKWSKGAQRLIGGRAMAREFDEKDISPDFRANGTVAPRDLDFIMHEATGFSEWRLAVGGLVDQPLSLSLDELRAMPSRTQITRHDCVEGWSSIGKWTGARLSAVLEAARMKPEAKYVVFYCMDTLDPAASDNMAGRYYESIDLDDALHEQTILAYDMNDAPLPVRHGAPLRLRVERQLGYKHAKYISHIDVVASLDGIGLGKGGFWPDRGYEWYAGI